MTTTTKTRKALAAGLMSLAAAGVALTAAGTASADTTVKVFSNDSGGYGSSFYCNSERALAVAADNKDGAGLYYGPCVQAPHQDVATWPTKPGKWYFTLKRH